MNNLIFFSAEHFISIGIYLLITIGLIFIGNFMPRKLYSFIVAISVLILKITELVFRYNYHSETIPELLPFHLCNITLILAIIFLIKPNEIAFQVIFYFGIGAFAAILFPENLPKFPDFSNISFFLTHFFILFSAWYQFIYFKYRPTLGGLFFSFIVLNILIGIAFKINGVYGTNYMYVSSKPNVGSFLDLFGPWPYYIGVVEGLFIAINLIYRLPFKEKTFKYF